MCHDVTRRHEAHHHHRHHRHHRVGHGVGFSQVRERLMHGLVWRPGAGPAAWSAPPRPISWNALTVDP